MTQTTTMIQGEPERATPKQFRSSSEAELQPAVTAEARM